MRYQFTEKVCQQTVSHGLFVSRQMTGCWPMPCGKHTGQLQLADRQVTIGDLLVMVGEGREGQLDRCHLWW